VINDFIVKFIKIFLSALHDDSANKKKKKVHLIMLPWDLDF